MPSESNSKISIVGKLLISLGFIIVFAIVYFIFSAFMTTKTEVGNINEEKKSVNADFVIKTPSERTIFVDAPRMLQLSQSEIEEKNGKPRATQVNDGIEERLYYVKTAYSQNPLEVKFGYFNGKPLYCRILMPYHETDDQNAFNLAGVDVGYVSPMDYLQLKSERLSCWYRGEFENRLYDLIISYRTIKDVSQSGGIANVLVKIYLPDEIVFEAKQLIGRAKNGGSGRQEIEKIKRKLQTVSEKSDEYGLAQQLIGELDEVLLKIAF